MAITVTSEQKCNELPSVTSPDSSYCLLAFEDGSNAGAKINYDALAEAILNKITTQEYTIGEESTTLVNAISALQTLSDTQETALTNASVGSYCQLWDNSVSIANRNRARNNSVYRYYASTGSELTGVPASYADITTPVAGYRQEFTQCDSGGTPVYSVISLYEILPNPGRIWHNTYNNGSWSGWKASSGKLVDSGFSGGVSVESHTYADVSISYNFAFPYTPAVISALYAAPNWYELGLCGVSVIPSSVTTSGFTARVYNASSGTRNLKVSWFAIG